MHQSNYDATKADSQLQLISHSSDSESTSKTTVRTKTPSGLEHLSSVSAPDLGLGRKAVSTPEQGADLERRISSIARTRPSDSALERQASPPPMNEEGFAKVFWTPHYNHVKRVAKTWYELLNRYILANTLIIAAISVFLVDDANSLDKDATNRNLRITNMLWFSSLVVSMVSTMLTIGTQFWIMRYYLRGIHYVGYCFENPDAGFQEAVRAPKAAQILCELGQSGLHMHTVIEILLPLTSSFSVLVFALGLLFRYQESSVWNASLGVWIGVMCICLILYSMFLYSQRPSEDGHGTSMSSIILEAESKYQTYLPSFSSAGNEKIPRNWV